MPKKTISKLFSVFKKVKKKNKKKSVLDQNLVPVGFFFFEGTITILRTSLRESEACDLAGVAHL